MDFVKSLEKFFPTTTYYCIYGFLSSIFTKKLPQNINIILRKFGFIYFSDILLLEQGG